MRRLFQLAMVVILCGGTCLSQGGEVLDRIVTIVNNTPIFQSDWELALRSEALMAGRSPESFDSTEQQAVFNRLVDQELLREQMRGFPVSPVSNEEVKSRLLAVRKEIQGADSDSGWEQLLARAGISETELSDRLRTQLEILRFLDARFRPLIRVDFRTVQKYYNEQFLPETRKRGAKDVPLSEVSSKIREILMQQRLDDQISSWMQTLREQADIRTPSNTREANQNK